MRVKLSNPHHSMILAGQMFSFGLATLFVIMVFYAALNNFQLLITTNSMDEGLFELVLLGVVFCIMAYSIVSSMKSRGYKAEKR